ncbi:hypothetical protein Droror1_Dr00018667 [Drosera rotundifolia]
MDQASHLKRYGVVLYLHHQLLANFARKLYLTAHHLDACQSRLSPHGREWLHVLVGDELVLIVELEDYIVEVDFYLTAWVCEVCQQCHVGVEEITHVKVCCIESRTHDLEMWTPWPVDEALADILVVLVVHVHLVETKFLAFVVAVVGFQFAATQFDPFVVAEAGFDLSKADTLLELVVAEFGPSVALVVSWTDPLPDHHTGLRILAVVEVAVVEAGSEGWFLHIPTLASDSWCSWDHC